ncbi:hypothetical protein K437DRAFT_262806 [Tilletiaria anomala UBC 951]|uniref:BHLH domain-containing protein n=1 Tax=Tilletiaria anomala (strain ATCC 24038 / CBS 436.72 / UBC 951) TaxID=1037660 RepID=A0A066VWW8_TILAU|nr:uncharacterized protein K437DRAFT_262806 [Tilletiaria anomala UBC 951]KDN45971.1 hypothetical protein K437DRAFT_262806 [Tilletiaria anomala UBC 951]
MDDMNSFGEAFLRDPSAIPSARSSGSQSQQQQQEKQQHKAPQLLSSGMSLHGSPATAPCSLKSSSISSADSPHGGSSAPSPASIRSARGATGAAAGSFSAESGIAGQAHRRTASKQVNRVDSPRVDRRDSEGLGSSLPQLPQHGLSGQVDAEGKGLAHLQLVQQAAWLKQQLERMQVASPAFGPQEGHQQQSQATQQQQQQLLLLHQQHQQQQAILQLLQLQQQQQQQNNQVQPFSPASFGSSVDLNQLNTAAAQLQQAFASGQLSIGGSSMAPSAAINLHAGVLAQYGLLTPVNSGSFNISNLASQHGIPSPLQIPSGSGIFTTGNTPGGDMSNVSHHSAQGQGHSLPQAHHCAYGPAAAGNSVMHTPVESPAITPASVFSALGNSSVASSSDFFSPLVSPALRPDPPPLGEMLPPSIAYANLNAASSPAAPYPQAHTHGHHTSHYYISTTPTASPLALIGRSGPPPSSSNGSGSGGVSGSGGGGAGTGTRKQRGASLMEGKSSKVRPSPLMKPQTGRRRRDNSMSTSTLPSPSMPFGAAGAGNSMSQPGSRRGSISEKNGAFALPAASNGGGSQARSRSSSMARNQSVGAGATAAQGQTIINGQVVGSMAAVAAAAAAAAQNLSNGFPPLGLTNGQGISMDASPEGGTTSTPSPIDLNAESQGFVPLHTGTSQPLTPASIMGLSNRQLQAPTQAQRQQQGQQLQSAALQHLPHLAQQVQTQGLVQASGKGSSVASPSPTRSSLKEKGKASGSESSRVTFSTPAGKASAQPILPGGLSSADRDAWMSIKIKGGEGVDSRRTSHKAAEQKRRDSLKYSLDELRGYLPAIMVDDEAPGGSILGPDGLQEDEELEQFSVAEIADPEQARIANKGISKVSLLRHSNEYLLRLRTRMERRDIALKEAREEVLRLRTMLARVGIFVDETDVTRKMKAAAGGKTAPDLKDIQVPLLTIAPPAVAGALIAATAAGGADAGILTASVEHDRVTGSQETKQQEPEPQSMDVS